MSIRRHLIRLLPELSKFGVVGLFGLLVDVGGFNLLRYAGGEGPLYDQPVTAKVISTTAATVVAWLGNRYWTFRDSRRTAAHHEFLVFVLWCSIGSAMAISCLAISHYLLRLTSPLADNISGNVIGLALGTTFRFWAYRTHVFSEHKPAELAPDVDGTASAPAPDHFEPETDRQLSPRIPAEYGEQR
jgi:putative flippase GtrA